MPNPNNQSMSASIMIVGEGYKTLPVKLFTQYGSLFNNLAGEKQSKTIDLTQITDFESMLANKLTKVTQGTKLERDASDIELDSQIATIGTAFATKIGVDPENTDVIEACKNVMTMLEFEKRSYFGDAEQDVKTGDYKYFSLLPLADDEKEAWYAYYADIYKADAVTNLISYSLYNKSNITDYDKDEITSVSLISIVKDNTTSNKVVIKIGEVINSLELVAQYKGLTRLADIAASMAKGSGIHFLQIDGGENIVSTIILADRIARHGLLPTMSKETWEQLYKFYVDNNKKNTEPLLCKTVQNLFRFAATARGSESFSEFAATHTTPTTFAKAINMEKDQTFINDFRDSKLPIPTDSKLPIPTDRNRLATAAIGLMNSDLEEKGGLVDMMGYSAEDKADVIAVIKAQRDHLTEAKAQTKNQVLGIVDSKGTLSRTKPLVEGGVGKSRLNRLKRM